MSNDYTPEVKKHAKKYLGILARKLDRVPRKQFNFSKWVDTDRMREQSCGFAGCAGGWATTLPSFRKLGLTRRWYGVGTEDMRDVDAMAEVLQLSYEDAQYLFLPAPLPEFSTNADPDLLPGTATPKQVAKRIREFIAEELS